ncbi:MAG: hypothetical protein CL596_04890 [Alteromonas sp.]|nr:hypothetical protein [Alteromonas sp.]|tara:strand:+ start:19189 stop:19581 length:393 start_codon:yes stop_codon:yes gene_type:complete
MSRNKFIGSGMVFPILINDKGRPDIISDSDLIKSSIKIILSWAFGTRYFNELFGSRVDELIEEPDDSVTKSLLKLFITESLNTWEKRITIKGIQLNNKGVGKIDAIIYYSVRNSKIEDTMIYPFYNNIIY